METLTTIATNYRDLFIVIHLFSLVLGLGGATYTDILLVRFLNDLKIDAKEADVIKTMSKTVFIGVVLALVSGIMLFLVKPSTLLATPKFQAKMLIFFIIMVNGFFLHRIVLHRLIHFSFDKDHYIISKFIHLRHAGFIMGAISAVSWYSVFFLGGFSWESFHFIEIITFYVIALIFGIFAALCIEKYIKTSSE